MLPESLAVCHLSLGEPAQTPNMRLAHLEILLLSGMFPYTFLRMSHMFVSKAKKVLRKEKREEEGGMVEEEERIKKGMKILISV